MTLLQKLINENVSTKGLIHFSLPWVIEYPSGASSMSWHSRFCWSNNHIIMTCLWSLLQGDKTQTGSLLVVPQFGPKNYVFKWHIVLSIRLVLIYCFTECFLNNYSSYTMYGYRRNTLSHFSLRHLSITCKSC